MDIESCSPFVRRMCKLQRNEYGQNMNYKTSDERYSHHLFIIVSVSIFQKWIQMVASTIYLPIPYITCYTYNKLSN